MKITTNKETCQVLHNKNNHYVFSIFISKYFSNVFVLFNFFFFSFYRIMDIGVLKIKNFKDMIFFVKAIVIRVFNILRKCCTSNIRVQNLKLIHCRTNNFVFRILMSLFRKLFFDVLITYNKFKLFFISKCSTISNKQTNKNWMECRMKIRTML